jgi:membrane associated rhomboid family serine protease
MLNVTVPILTVFAIGWTFARFFVPGGPAEILRKGRRRLRIGGSPKSIPRDDRGPGAGPASAADVRELVRRFGQNSNSFMTLYPGFSYFTEGSHEDLRGAVAYVDTPSAWVGGAEPLTEPASQLALLRRFSDAASAEGKTAILLPVAEALARQAATLGFRSIMIGSEATFSLDRYPKTGRTWLDVVPTAKQLHSRGARVRELIAISEGLRHELDDIAREWLGSRKTSALGFLNQVDPWVYAEHKRYFSVELDGRVLAFIAAIPIWARGGWYLVDLIRRTETPAGTTELLLLQTMKLLKESGAIEVTLGVAPLSGLENRAKARWAERDRHPFLYRVLHFVYQHGDWFYNFKSLHLYKLKFEPTRSEPMFLIYHRANRKLGRLRLRDALGLSRAFLPRGMLRASWDGAIRMLTRFNLADAIARQIHPAVVVKSTPRSWPQLLGRVKFTLAILLINLGFYFVTTDSGGKIDPRLEHYWGYSWHSFLEDPIRALALSPFLHWDLIHLDFNLITLLLFTGTLEYVAGSWIASSSYLIPMILTNPVTSFLLERVLRWNSAPGHHSTSAIIDVGASLGVFGTLGALFWYLKRGTWILSLISIAVLFQAAMSGNWLVLDHCVAIALGLGLGRLALH